MKPTKSKIYCRECGRSKILFSEEKKALNFIKFNSEEILQESGRAPVRAYYCECCGGWHVTSSLHHKTSISETSNVIKKYRENTDVEPTTKEEIPIITVEINSTKVTMNTIDSLYDRLGNLSYNIHNGINTFKDIKIEFIDIIKQLSECFKTCDYKHKTIYSLIKKSFGYDIKAFKNVKVQTTK